MNTDEKETILYCLDKEKLFKIKFHQNVKVITSNETVIITARHKVMPISLKIL